MLRILTWNILAPGWFCMYQDITYGLNFSKKNIVFEYDSFHEMRLDNVINSIKVINPDIICLQEVTPNSLKIIKKKLKYRTYFSFIMNKNIANEGIATLYNPKSEAKIQKTIKFIDSENEPNIYTYVKKGKNNYLILNVHLPRGGKTYKSLHYTLNYNNKKLLQDLKNKNIKFIICGDFNSSNYITKNIEKKYKKFYWSKSTTEDYNNYSKLLTNINMIDTNKNNKNFYTTKKEDNIKDHEDHIFVRNNLKYKIYYGDFIQKFDLKKKEQGEKGLLHFTQKNLLRKNWKKIYKNLTSDHRWICIDLL